MREACSVTGNEPYHCRPLKREQKILVCAVVLLEMGYGKVDFLLFSIIQNHGFTIFRTVSCD